MSHKENDRYYEELKEAEEEVKQEKYSLKEADEESDEALRWRNLRLTRLQDAEKRLAKLKEKDL